MFIGAHSIRHVQSPRADTDQACENSSENVRPTLQAVNMRWDVNYYWQLLPKHRLLASDGVDGDGGGNLREGRGTMNDAVAEPRHGL